MNKKKRLMPYVGYGKPNIVVLMGSVLYGNMVKDAKTEDSKWRNSKKMLQLFLAKPTVNEQVTILFHNHSKTITTDKNGYFKTTLQLTSEIKAGWHSVYYYLDKDTAIEVRAENKCLIIDDSVSLGVISDIDDTIVVSHSHCYRKKIWTALSKNAKTRKPNKTLSEFYNKLHSDKTPFFYVSSSERNLYEFWIRFMEINKFPSGPLLLKELKYGLSDFIFSGKGKHYHKYEKINGILKFYPNLNFVLVGDNGQKDVEIYHSIVIDFPDRIKGVFIVPTLQKSLDRDVVADCKKHNVNILTIDNSSESLNTALKELCL